MGIFDQEPCLFIILSSFSLVPDLSLLVTVGRRRASSMCLCRKFWVSGVRLGRLFLDRLEYGAHSMQQKSCFGVLCNKVPILPPQTCQFPESPKSFQVFETSSVAPSQPSRTEGPLSVRSLLEGTDAANRARVRVGFRIAGAPAQRATQLRIPLLAKQQQHSPRILAQTQGSVGRLTGSWSGTCFKPDSLTENPQLWCPVSLSLN